MIATSHPQAHAMEAILVDRNKNLIWHVAKKYHWSNLEPADLFTEGVEGLLKAARKFEAGRGVKFATYAVPWIRQCMGRASEGAGLVRVPSHCYESINKLTSAYEVLGKGASSEELCAYLRWTPAKLEGVLSARRAGTVASLDAPITNNSSKGESDTELMEFQAMVGGDPFETVARTMTGETLTRLMAALSPRQAQVIRERFLDNSEDTLVAIGKRIGVSRERVRQLETEALRLLQTSAKKAGLHV
jgi:RNA polymerase sigma factor (sigma-70 family)